MSRQLGDEIGLLLQTKVGDRVLSFLTDFTQLWVLKCGLEPLRVTELFQTIFIIIVRHLPFSFSWSHELSVELVQQNERSSKQESPAVTCKLDI